MEFVTQSVAPIVGAIGGVIGIASMIYTWLTSRSKTNAADIKALGGEVAKKHIEIDENLKKHDRRIQKVEDELNHLPTQNEVHELKLAMERLNGNVEVLAERLGAIGRVVTTIDESLRREEIKNKGDAQ